MEIFKKYFYNKDQMTDKDYKYARFGFIVDDAANMGAYALAGGSYVAGLLAYLGASEANGLKVTVFGFEFCEMHLVFIAGALIILISAASLIFTSKKKMAQ